MVKQSVLRSLLIIGLLTVGVFSAERVPLIERFTNTSCGYCPPCGVMVDTLDIRWGDQLAVLEVHCNWPSSSDPYYVHAPTDNQVRWTHYSVSGVPTVSVDGYKLPSWSSAATMVGSLIGSYTPLSLNIIPGNTIYVSVNIEEPFSSVSNRLFVAIVEDSLYFPSAPNGEIWANNVLRKLLPSTSGQTIDLSSTGTQNFAFPLELHPVWNTDRLKVVAWVQDMSAPVSAYNIQNAKVEKWRLEGYHYNFTSDRIKELAPASDTSEFSASIVNIGSLEDTYIVRVEEDIPAGWSAWATLDGIEFDSTAITLDVLEDNLFDVFIAPSGSRGQGRVRLIVESIGDTTAAVDTLTFTVLSGGDLLYVAGVKVSESIPLYRTLFNDNEVGFHEWNIATDGQLSDFSEAPYNAIVWHDGYNLDNPLTFAERGYIRNYLNNGGKMLVTSASWGRTVGSIFDFYYTLLGATTDGTDSSPSSVMGTYGGTEFTGFNADLLGHSAEGFSVLAPSRGILRLSSGKTCGLTRITDGGGKIVYVSFRLEDIDGYAPLNDFWSRVVEFWGGLDVPEHELPVKKALIEAYPNPFNSVLSVDVTTPTIDEISIEAFDISGRLIENLFCGTVSANSYTVRWDTGDLPSGLFLIRVSGKEFSETKKVLLIK